MSVVELVTMNPDKRIRNGNPLQDEEVFAIEKIDRFRGSLIGLAVGDCMGVPAEFLPPGHFSPITDLRGGGPFGLEIGQWTDDTSMALCLAESLIQCQGFNAKDQMNRYVRWYKDGYNSSKDVCFDIGNTVKKALEDYLLTKNPYSGSKSPRTAGNGSVMRLAPVPLVWSFNLREAIKYASESSKTTHQAEETIDACAYYGALLAGTLQDYSKEELLSNEFYESIEKEIGRPLSPNISEVGKGSYKYKKPPQIKGTGYVIQSIEAALWAFNRTEDFSTGLLLAVNLGDDADTTGAIYGQLAGAFYGFDAIRNDWVKQIVQGERILQLADSLYDLYNLLSMQNLESNDSPTV